MITIVSENYFKNDQSDYAKSLRALYGADGYEKYTKTMNSIMDNPLKKSHEEYTLKKQEQYKLALAKAKKARTIWNDYKNNYSNNLALMRQNNNGFSLTGMQKHNALQASGSGAVEAFNNFNSAESEVDYALSLYNDATHSSVNFMG